MAPLKDKVVFLVGAGLSVAHPSNLPTFRTLKGMYNDKEVFYFSSIKGYHENPVRANQIFDSFLEKILKAESNEAHKALNNLVKLHPDRIKIINQNVDGLIQNGIPLYGNMCEIYCSTCKIPREYPLPIAETFKEIECPFCNKRTEHRRNITLFNELSPNLLVSLRSVNECMLFIAVGTEISTYPARLLLRLSIQNKVRRLLVNQTPLIRDIHSLFDEFQEGCANGLVPPLCKFINTIL